jgi:small subunit ribosomal protein S16
MVVIRLARSGQKGTPVYKIQVADKYAKLNGRFIEKLGTLRLSSAGATTKKDANTSERYVLELNSARYQHWVKLGAQPSPRMAKIVKDFKILSGEAETVAPKAEKAAKAAAATSKTEKTDKKPAAKIHSAPKKAATKKKS